MSEAKSAPTPSQPNAAAPSESGKKAPPSKLKQSLERLKSVKWRFSLSDIGSSTRELFKALRSPDLPSRRMARYFFASLLGLILVMGVTTQRFLRDPEKLRKKLTAVDPGAKQLGAFFEKQSEDAKRKYSSQNLGSFTLELKSKTSQIKVAGVMNLAEIEIVAQCDLKATCDYLENHLLQARNQVTSLLTPTDRDDLLTREGKARLKRQLIQSLNSWLGHVLKEGKVVNLYFTRFLVS